ALAAADSDHDGSLVPDEAHRLAGMLEGPAGRLSAESFDSLAANGRIPLPVVIRHLMRVAPPVELREEPGVSGTAIFSILDSNADRRLSLDELSGAEQLLRRSDFNGDEVITADELLEDPRAKVAVDPAAGQASRRLSGAMAFLELDVETGQIVNHAAIAA